MIRRALVAIAVLLLLAGSGRSQERLHLELEREGGPVQLRADELVASRAEQRIDARGSVVATWAGYRLVADRVSYDQSSGVVTAEGKVKLTDEAGNVLECRRLTVQVETQRGEVEDGSLFVAREGYHVWGKKFVRTGPNSYVVEKGGFTACDGTWPSWRIWADRVQVDLESSLVARGASFWVEGLPVLYTPYVLFPILRERQSGFLLPKAGYSSTNGLLLIGRYYWAFADNADLLAQIEYRSKRGWTEVGQLRYVLAEGHFGSVEVSHLYDRVDDAHRFTVKADHRSQIDPATRVRLHVDYLGDTSILKDFGDTITERGVQRLESYVLAARDLDAGTAFGFADYFEALDQSQSQVLQTLPSAGILGRETPVLGGLNWDPTFKVSRFWRDQGLRSTRWQADPGLSWGTSLGGVGLAARAGYRQNLYQTSEKTVSHGAAGAEAEASAVLSRSYGGVIHTLEPKAVLDWEEAGRGAEAPQFDDADLFQNRAGISFLLDSRLLSAPGLSSLAFLQLERRLDLGAVRRSGWREGAFGPWQGQLTLTPVHGAGLHAEAEYDPSLQYPWLRWTVEGHGSDRRGDKVFAGYHYLKESAGYLDAGAALAVTPVLSLEYRHRHSFRDQLTLEESYGVRLTHPCWELLLTYSRDYRADLGRDERRYLAAVELKGLGKIGALRGIVP